MHCYLVIKVPRHLPAFRRSRHTPEGTGSVGSPGDTLGRTSRVPGQGRALEIAGSAAWCHPSPTAGCTEDGRGSSTVYSSTPVEEGRRKKGGGQRKWEEVGGGGRRKMKDGS